MPRNSLKKLLDKFPYFLDKSDSSNFTKTQKVFNNRLVDVYNELFQVYLAGKLEKNLLIWKEQDSAKDYTINFFAGFPFLKSVICYKNDEVIYTESFNYNDEVNTFFYSHDDSSDSLIPEDKYKIYVTTYDEYSMTKGFPENDTILSDEYDHDTSLDAFGALYNIPRKQYKKIDTNELSQEQIVTYYTKTEPSFNNRLTEDDYHYMNRILKYISYFNKIPLSVLEIWKLYGLDPEDSEEISFINRERYIAKMFEESRHLTSDGIYDPDWKPERWEHKDSIWCPVKPDIFFFANVNNASPVQGMRITFDFDFIDEYARRTSTDYYIIPYLIKEVDGELVYVKYPVNPLYTKDSYLWTVKTNELPDIESEYDFDFIFRAYEKYQDMIEENSRYLESDIIKITIKGCNSADWYVDCVDGLDTNEGKTRETAFRTLTHALKQMHGSENVIALINRNQNFNIENVQIIDENCSIISCPAGATIYQNNGWEFFKIMQDCNLYLQNIKLKHKCCTMHSVSTDFIDQNALNYPIHVAIPKWVCKINTKIDMTKDYTVYAHHQYQFTGKLLTDTGDYEVGAEYVDGITRNCPVSTRDPDEPVNGEEIDLYLNNQYLFTNRTGNDGSYNFNHAFDNIGNYVILAKHEESKVYCNSENSCRVTVNAMPTKLSITNPSNKIYIEDPFTVQYTVKDYYDNPVTVGKIKLYEDDVLVKTVNNGETLTYVPVVAGLHTYRVKWSHNATYLTSESTFTVDVVKYETSLFLIGEGKSIYAVDENVEFTGVLTDENSQKLSDKSVKVYDGTTLLRTLTTDSNGEIHYSGRLSAGNHTLHLEFDETSKYYDSVSNSYRVRVRDSELPDIQLYLYPEYKILGSKLTNIPVHVYACNKQGQPIATSFKLWNTYDNACETNPSTTYSTGNDGWWSGNITTQSIQNCEGTYIQAISTLDEDVCSKVIHIRYTVEPELEVTPTILVDKSVYSYKDEVIHVSGDLIDEEEDPVPNENLTVKVYADNSVVKTFNLTTDLRGEFSADYTTTSSVRGKDLRFELTYAKHTKAYAACSDEVTVYFKQLATSVLISNSKVNEGDDFTITGSIIDENNLPADTGAVKITFNGSDYNVNLLNGVFSLPVDGVIIPGNYPVKVIFIENTYYKTSNKTVNVKINDITSTLTLNKQFYSYNDEVIMFSGSIVNEENAPISDDVTVKVYADNTLVKTFNLQSDNHGFFESSYTTTSSVRGKDLKFKLEYYKQNGEYLACESESSCEFKQLTTTINAENVSFTAGQKIRLTGTIIDENNIPADTGAVKITFNGSDYNVNLVNGVFSLLIDELLLPNNYSTLIGYAENTYYKLSNKTITCAISKLTPILTVANEYVFIRDERSILSYDVMLPAITNPTTDNIPVSGDITLLLNNGEIITSCNVGDDLEVTFHSVETINCKLEYEGNAYLNLVRKTGIIIHVSSPSVILKDSETGPWDVNLMDEYPADTTSYDGDDYIIRTISDASDNHPVLTITDDPDYDTSGSGEDDIVLVDTNDGTELIIKDEDED